MPDRKMHKSIEGRVSHVFAHRFVVETGGGAILADLTPHGAKVASVETGDVVSLDGEVKPSELKVSRIAINGGPSVVVEHGDRHDDSKADPAIAKDAASRQGFAVLAEPRRKPKHFEVLVRDARGEHQELHVEFDGHIRKSRPADPAEPKWHE